VYRASVHTESVITFVSYKGLKMQDFIVLMQKEYLRSLDPSQVWFVWILFYLHSYRA
jgi:hypothetical protein